MSTVNPDQSLGQDPIADKSLGELVAMATESVSRLVKSEVELAKQELRDDLKRVVMSAALFVVAGFIACLILVLLSIAAAYGLVAAGIWHWAAFLIVAGAYALLAAGFILIGRRWIRRLTGLPRTRRTLRDDLTMLRGGTPAGGRDAGDGETGARTGSGDRGGRAGGDRAAAAAK
jgi:uncharacterized membrane protein YqjE